MSVLRNTHSKPKHNRYDNIWEIRSEGYPTKSQLADAIAYRPRLGDIMSYAGGRILCYRSEEAFCSTLIRGRFKLPIWKVILPEPNASMGIIYYAAEDAEGRLHLFRGTYGYRGVGPHQSAFIEAFIEDVLGLSPELRGGDLLIDLILGREVDSHA